MPVCASCLRRKPAGCFLDKELPKGALGRCRVCSDPALMEERRLLMSPQEHACLTSLEGLKRVAEVWAAWKKKQKTPAN